MKKSTTKLNFPILNKCLLALVFGFSLSLAHAQNVALDDFIFNVNNGGVCITVSSGPEYWETVKARVKIEGTRNTAPFDKIIYAEGDYGVSWNSTCVPATTLYKDDGYSYTATVTYRERTETEPIEPINVEYTTPLSIQEKNGLTEIEFGELYTIVADGNAEEYEWLIHPTSIMNFSGLDIVNNRGNEIDIRITNPNQEIKVRMRGKRNGRFTSYKELRLKIGEEGTTQDDLPQQDDPPRNVALDDFIFSVTNTAVSILVSSGPEYWESVRARVEIEGTRNTAPFDKKNYAVGNYSVIGNRTIVPASTLYKDDGYSYTATVTYKGRTETEPIVPINIEYATPLSIQEVNGRTQIERDEIYTIVASGEAEDYQWQLHPTSIMNFNGLDIVNNRGSEIDIRVTTEEEEVEVRMRGKRNGRFGPYEKLRLKVRDKVIIQEELGRTELCRNSEYSIVASGPQADNYEWRVFGAQNLGVRNNGTSLRLRTPNSFSSIRVTLRVRYDNEWSPIRTLTFNRCRDLSIPSIGIRENNGADEVCPNERYTISATGDNAIQYDWSASGARIIQNNGNRISIETNSSFSSVVVRVRARNDGYWSSRRTLTLDKCCQSPPQFTLRHGDGVTSGKMCYLSDHQIRVNGEQAEQYIWSINGGGSFFIETNTGQRAYSDYTTTTSNTLWVQTGNGLTGNRVNITVTKVNDCGKRRSKFESYELVRLCRARTIAADDKAIHAELLYPSQVRTGDEVLWAGIGNVEVKSLEAIDVQGKSLGLQYEQMDDESLTFTTASLSAGIYIMRLTTSNGLMTSRLTVR